MSHGDSQWTKEQIKKATDKIEEYKEEYKTLKKDLTMNSKKPYVTREDNTRQMEAIKKHLNVMASTVTSLLEMMSTLKDVNVRLSQRIGDLEDKEVEFDICQKCGSKHSYGYGNLIGISGRAKCLDCDTVLTVKSNTPHKDTYTKESGFLTAEEEEGLKKVPPALKSFDDITKKGESL